MNTMNNKLGRIFGNSNFHTVFPWVLDFKSATSYRDLSQSKDLIAKGKKKTERNEMKKSEQTWMNIKQTNKNQTNQTNTNQ